MVRFLEQYFHRHISRILFWNVVMLVFVKIVIPQSVFQVASIIDSIPVFNSREIIDVTNESRVSGHLQPLKANSQLDIAASEKLNDMAIKEYFAHTSPQGVTPWFWIKKSQYSYSVAGENLAIGFFTAKETVQAWLNSPSHRANILNPKYQDIGVAVKGVQIGNQKGTLVVQMFGLPGIQTTVPTTVALAKNPNPIPTSTPQTAVLTPTPAIPTPQTQGESTISTDINVATVQSPVSVKFEDTENLTKWSYKLNSIYTTYALFIALLSMVTFLLFERSRLTAMRMAFNFALFALAVIIPVAQVSFKGLIF